VTINQIFTLFFFLLKHTNLIYDESFLILFYSSNVNEESDENENLWKPKIKDEEMVRRFLKRFFEIQGLKLSQSKEF
jgi:hypothetical protein